MRGRAWRRRSGRDWTAAPRFLPLSRSAHGRAAVRSASTGRSPVTQLSKSRPPPHSTREPRAQSFPATFTRNPVAPAVNCPAGTRTQHRYPACGVGSVSRHDRGFPCCDSMRSVPSDQACTAQSVCSSPLLAKTRSHQSWFLRYQSTVPASPRSNSISGSQPSSDSIFAGSIR